nr:reverse transcriptase domain-containing protein [Tanacetum cinerariifolium]
MIEHPNHIHYSSHHILILTPESNRVKGAPECMRISGFMHGINNPELTKRLNEHVPKTMEEMMIAITAFIRGEAMAASKKKGHGSWKTQDQSKRHTDKRLDFRGHSRDGRGANRFTPLTRTPKEILAAEANKFQPPPPMVTPVEKRNSNKFLRARKLSHLIKEIKQGREQPKTGRKEAAAKNKPTTIYMVRSWQRTVKQEITQSFEQGKEITFPPLTTSNGIEGPLVIEAEIGGHTIHRMYIDDDSSMEILYEHCFNRLRPEIKSQMVPATTSLTGFSGETTWPLGQLRLLVTIGDVTHSTKACMNFMVVKSLSPYNGIIGRPGLKAIQAVPSTVHGMLKFPTEEGIVTIRSSLLIPVECVSIDTSSVTSKKKRTRPTNLTVTLHPNFPDQEVVGGSLSDRGRTELCSLLKKNLDIFAWQPSDMTGVPRSIAEHRLNIPEGCPPVRQKKRGQAPEHTKAIQAEVQKLVEARIMREVYYHDWLSNPVMVKKHDGSWRMCVDFTDLNKACPQDCNPLPEIDWKVESLCGYPFKCFLDAYKGYHQIQLAEADEEKTAFHTRQGGPELNYSPMEKLVLSLVFAAKRLRRYFQAHPITVITDQPIKQVMSSPDVAGRLQKWSIMLGEHNITYRPRTSIKGQILVDFLNEMPGNTSQGVPAAVTQEEPWTLFTDGSSCVDGSGAGLILTNPEGVEFTYALRFQFAASNNEAEYEALVAGLRIATQMGVKNVQANVDSKLVGNQVLGTYVAKEDNMIKYLEIVKGLVSRFTTFSISQVPQSRNKKADALSKIASTSFAHLSKQVLVEVLETKSITGKEVTAVIDEEGPTWMTELVNYLKEGILPGDEKEAWKFRLKARQYELMEGVLYKRSFLTPWLRCMGPLQAEYDMIHKCSDCQIHRPITRHPQQPLTPITAPWPFYKWGIDIAGPFLEGPRKVKFLIVAMDYFTKWIEAKAVATITSGQVKKFIWDNIVCRFVIPAEIRMPTYRTAPVDAVNNDEEVRLNLDLLEERRELAAMSEAKYKSKMMKYYNARVRVAGGKLGPKWEGPYEVTDALGNGAYKLRSTDETVLSRTWNVTNLKRCYL